MDKSFPCREDLHKSAYLPKSPTRLGSIFVGTLFSCSVYSQWTFTGDGLASYRPMDMDPSGPSYRARWALFLSSSIAPFTPFGPSLFEKESQLGWRLKNYRLTIQCSWVDGWNDGVDGDKVNGMTVGKAEVIRYTNVWQVVRKHLWRMTHVVFWLVFISDRSVVSSFVFL